MEDKTDSKQCVILDTNVFVAAGFNKRSHSAQIIELIRKGNLQIVWHQRTHAETEMIVTKIPPLSWDKFSGLFVENNRHTADLETDPFSVIGDRSDRKFAALATATGATLLTTDSDLLGERQHLLCTILKPSEFWETYSSSLI